MYWSVLSCALLVESWVEFILVWVPFYSYMRLFFLLYLVLPQTQGARYLYETYLYSYLAENETQIEDFIASAHDRLRAAGIKYLKQAIEILKTKVLGMPPGEPRQEEMQQSQAAQGYTQNLLARFSVPAARWATSGGASKGATDFYNLLAGAVSAAAGYGGPQTGGGSPSSRNVDMSAGSTLVPDHIGNAQDKMSFIASQKEKLAFVLNALDKEAKELEKSEEERRALEQVRKEQRAGSISLDGGGGQSGDSNSRPPSGQSMWSALSKSRSEVDFEKIDADALSGGEEDEGMRRRQTEDSTGTGRGAWRFLGWATVAAEHPPVHHPAESSGQSSGFEK